MARENLSRHLRGLEAELVHAKRRGDQTLVAAVQKEIKAAQQQMRVGEVEMATVDPPETRTSAVVPDDDLVCDVCGFEAANKGGLTIHAKSHEE